MNSDSEIVISLFNKLYDSFKKRNLKSLYELIYSEKNLKEFFLEIEPKLEQIGGKIEINEDNNYGIRYANVVSILNCIEKYLAKSPDRERFTNFKDFKNWIIINDLLKNEKEQLMNLAEIILFISSISSKKDFYLDKISELDDIRYVNTYFSHIEKYILLDNKIDETFQSNMDRSYMMNNQFVKLREEFERERETLIKTIKENEKIINKLNSKNENLERLNSEIGIKLKDKQKELEFFKLNQNQNIRAQEEMFKDNLINSELIIKLNEKEIELNDVKRENEVAVKRLNDDLIRYKEKIEAYDDKLQEYKSFKVQNDKLNLKIKELNIVKERNKDYEDIKNNLDHKNKQIENLLKEKQILVNEIEKLRKEILNEKEKFRQADFDKKKMECDYNEVRKEFSRLESKNRFNNFYDLKRMPSNINNNSEILAEDMKLIDLGGDSMIFDDLKDYKIKNTVNEKEYLEVKNEKNELYKLYKAQIDEIHKLIDEKDRLLNTIDNYKLETEKYNSDKERLGIEKEKLEIIIQKSDLDCQKLKIHIERYENEKKRMEEENKELNEKMEILTNDRNLKIKEIEQLKNSANFNKNLADKALSEKQSVVNECHNLQLENEKLKFNWSDPNNNLLQPTINKNKSKISPKNSANLSEAQNEINMLKNEIQTLKKEETIKSLKDKIKNLQDASDNFEKNSQDSAKLCEDLEFYKRSYEEQKNRVNREHELISASLYELALQFMSLKTELQKKMNHNDSNGKK